MNRWSRIVLGIAVAGLAGWIATGFQGRLVGAEREALALHTLAAFASTLALILADAWIVIFLVACERSLRRAGHGAGGPLGHLALVRNRVTILAIAAAAATLAQVMLSGRYFPGRLPGWSHVALACVALLLQGALWIAARGALRTQHAICAALESAG